jgi:hypothetical protein
MSCQGTENAVVYCTCNLPARRSAVRREGSNQGREFYACNRPRAESCGFFQWCEEETYDEHFPYATPTQKRPAQPGRIAPPVPKRAIAPAGLTPRLPPRFPPSTQFPWGEFAQTWSDMSSALDKLTAAADTLTEAADALLGAVVSSNNPEKPHTDAKTNQKTKGEP